MEDIWIITAPILEGVRIKQYRGLTIARSVRAVDVVRDFFTSFRDFVGGRSRSYQEVVDEMQYEILDELKQQARHLGANAIIGFRIDFDNIGSKGKSLMMGVGTGTAVTIEKPGRDGAAGEEPQASDEPDAGLAGGEVT